MGLFGSSKPRISEKEFKEAVSSMYSRGLDQNGVDEIKKIFRADLHESEEGQYGIDAKELDNAMAWLKSNRSMHRLSDRDIEIAEEELREKLN